MAVEGFLGRWSRRKREAEREPLHEREQDRALDGEHDRESRAENVADSVREDVRNPGQALAAPSTNPPAAQGDAAVPAPTGGAGIQARAASITDVLPDIATLSGDSDFSPFMRASVDPGLRVAALKKLFADPRFNQMDGLDVYIDDYGKPDPLPPGMLRRLEQGRSLGLFQDDEEGLEQVAAADSAAIGETPPKADETGSGTDTSTVIADGSVEGADGDEPGKSAAAAADAGAGRNREGFGNAEANRSIEGDWGIEGDRDIEGAGSAGAINRSAAGESDRRGTA